MPDPGTVMLVDFPGVVASKRRPAVVLSSAVYHAARPDMIVGLVTGQVGKANTSFDYALQDWAAAGLVKPSAFRAFVWTVPMASNPVTLGRLSQADYDAVRERVRRAVKL